MSQSVLFPETDIGAPSSAYHKGKMGAKELGAYYTDSQISERLVEWAIRESTDTVLDPSFGGGVFLRSACKRLREIGAAAADQIFGVEVDKAVHAEIGTKLCQEFGITADNLVLSDFFALPSKRVQVDCVVGNPPFIRFHRFSGEDREIALRRCREYGVELSRLSSSWAPFLIHSISMLKPGGRLAMVVPAELTYASYAGPVLNFISSSFRSVQILSFRDRLFPDLSEDTYLLLADGLMFPNEGVILRDYRDVGQLSIENFEPCGELIRDPIHVPSISSGTSRLVEHYLDPAAKGIYHNLKSLASVQPLGIYADVGIGYVTGANSFFHLHPSEAKSLGITANHLRRAVFRGRGLRGMSLSANDWETAIDSGDTGLLLDVPRDAAKTGQLATYLKKGEADGVNLGFKCRNRQPWFSVPHVHVPDAFLTYMSGRQPKLVGNELGAVAPNTLHIVRMRSGQKQKLKTLICGWHSSLARLSLEIEGHVMGGGMLKVEPSEASRIRLPFVESFDLEAVHEEMDRLLRDGNEAALREVADEVILRQGLGLSQKECQLLSQAAEELALRRASKEGTSKKQGV